MMAERIHTVLMDIAPSSPSWIIPAPLIARPPLWVDHLLADAAPAVTAAGGVTITTATPFAQFHISIGNALAMSREELRARVTDAYIAIGEAISARQHHPIRFWNFVPTPGEELAPRIDRYMVFNSGRYDAYARWHGTARAFSHALATASAVGVQGNDLVIVCLASLTPGRPIENPRQTPSWQYSTRYGPKPPCFARATMVSHARERRLLIGGTASIVGEDSKHVGDPAGQVEETIANLSALIATARSLGASGSGRAADATDAMNGVSAGSTDDIKRLHDVRVYVARAQDAALVQRMVIARCPGMRRLEVTLSQICRPELLVEIEGIAVI
jgi:chorismate lyase / 3-hydroxybenzoate synthase